MKNKRTVSISFRVSAEEKEMITQAAKAFKKSVSGFIRDIIMGISGDIIKIFNRRHTEIPTVSSAPKNLNPPKRTLPLKPIRPNQTTKRGSTNDYRMCMNELKEVLKERCISLAS